MAWETRNLRRFKQTYNRVYEIPTFVYDLTLSEIRHLSPAVAGCTDGMHAGSGFFQAQSPQQFHLNRLSLFTVTRLFFWYGDCFDGCDCFSDGHRSFFLRIFLT